MATPQLWCCGQVCPGPGGGVQSSHWPGGAMLELGGEVQVALPGAAEQSSTTWRWSMWTPAQPAAKLINIILAINIVILVVAGYLT